MHKMTPGLRLSVQTAHWKIKASNECATNNMDHFFSKLNCAQQLNAHPVRNYGSLFYEYS